MPYTDLNQKNNGSHAGKLIVKLVTNKPSGLVKHKNNFR